MESVTSDKEASEATYIPGHDFVVDSLGRKYPVDKYVFRIRESHRPDGFIPEGLNKLSNAAQKKVLTELEGLPAVSGTVSNFTWSESIEHVEELLHDYGSWGDL